MADRVKKLRPQITSHSRPNKVIGFVRTGSSSPSRSSRLVRFGLAMTDMLGRADTQRKDHSRAPLNAASTAAFNARSIIECGRLPGWSTFFGRANTPALPYA